MGGKRTRSLKHKKTSKPVRTEVRVWDLDPLEQQAPILWHAGPDHCPAVDHRSFLPDQESSGHAEQDTDGLRDECAKSSDVGNLDSIEVALYLRDATACCHWLEI